MQNSIKTTEQVLIEKKSFQLYKDSLKILSRLSDEQAGKLFRAIVDFNNGETPQLDQTLSLVFFPFENQFVRDVDAYIKQCEVNKQNGSKGGRPRNEKTESVNSLYEKPKKADKDTDTDNEKETESGTVNTHTHLFDFSYYKTVYTELPSELQTIITPKTWEKWQYFNRHIDDSCKNIRKIPEQMDFNGYIEYGNKYIKTGIISSDRLKIMLSKFNNCQSAQRYVSVSSGLTEWTEREITYLKSA